MPEIKITPFLWFAEGAEEAARFYTFIFPNSRILETTRYSEESAAAARRPVGSAMTVAFQLDGQDFVALNGGPAFRFTEAVSFVVECESQEQVDYYWSKLGEGGDPQAQMCGWLKDRYGLSWQIVPKAMLELLGDPDPQRSRRAVKAMLSMKKLDVEALKRAAEG